MRACPTAATPPGTPAVTLGTVGGPVHCLHASMDQTPPSSARQRRLGTLLREARVAAGMRQTRMAELLGRGQAFVSKYESGARGLDAIDFIEIVELTGCDIGHVIDELRLVQKD